MIGRKTSGQDYRTVLDPRRARRARLLRATVAGVAMLILLLVLWRGDLDESPDEAEVVPPVTLPDPAQLPPLASAPEAEEAQAMTVTPETEGGFPLLPVPDDPSRIIVTHDAEQAPGESEHAAPDAAQASASKADAEGEQALAANVPGAAAESTSAAQSASTEPPATRPAPPPRAARAAAGDAKFALQFGDFGAVDAAEALGQRLADADHQPEVQRRVAVGPFSSAEEAERTRARLVGERGLKGVTVREPVSRQWLVQVGVFARPANAEALRSRLAERGYPALVHARVVMGPYPGENAARAALRGLDEKGVQSQTEARLVPLR